MNILLTTAATSFIVAAAPVVAQESLLLSPTESLAGKSQTEWSINWWQWAFSFERVRSPIADQTGALCASRQSGDVWFLAGTYGTKRVERTCTVPYGKTLFFPLINYIAFRGEESTESCMSLGSRAKELTNNPSALVLEINGKRFENLKTHRLASRCFSVVQGQRADAVSDGYLVAIRPLPRGIHVLNFGGILPTLMQAVTYTITVE